MSEQSSLKRSRQVPPPRFPAPDTQPSLGTTPYTQIPELQTRSISPSSSLSIVSERFNTRVTTTPPAAQPQQENPAKQPRRRLSDMSKAPQFYGKPGQLEPVLTYCMVKSLANSQESDEEKCGHLASLFRGPALTWLTSTLESTPKILGNYKEFVATLKAQFGVSDTAKKHQAAKALRNLTQKGSAQLYAIALEQHCAVLGHSDELKLTYFIEGLKLHVREALITRGNESRTYSTAKEEAIRIDTELYNARRRGAGRTGQGQARQSQSGGIKCHKCGQFGHKKSACRSSGREEF